MCQFRLFPYQVEDSVQDSSLFTDELEGNGNCIMYFAKSIFVCMRPKQISSDLCKQVVVLCCKRGVFPCCKLDVNTI